jgi:hypothetical protein
VKLVLHGHTSKMRPIGKGMRPDFKDSKMGKGIFGQYVSQVSLLQKIRMDSWLGITGSKGGTSIRNISVIHAKDGSVTRQGNSPFHHSRKALNIWFLVCHLSVLRHMNRALPSERIVKRTSDSIRAMLSYS